MVFLQTYATLNVNCLRSKNKQTMLRNFVKENDIDLLLLQEINIEDLNFIGNQYEYVTNIGDDFRDTAIVYRRGLEIAHTEKHTSGRITSILLKDQTLIINMYLHSGNNYRLESENIF